MSHPNGTTLSGAISTQINILREIEMHLLKRVCTEDQGTTDSTLTAPSTCPSADDRQMDTGGCDVRFRSDQTDTIQGCLK
jgi:hypothetical protein